MEGRRKCRHRTSLLPLWAWVMVWRTACNRRSSLINKAMLLQVAGMHQLLAEALTIKTNRPVCRRSSLRCRGGALTNRISSPTCHKYSLLCRASRGNHRCSHLSSSNHQLCSQLAAFTVRATATSLDTTLPLTTDQCLPVLYADSEVVSNTIPPHLKTTSARLHGVEAHDSKRHHHQPLDATSHGVLWSSSSNKATSPRPQCQIHLSDKALSAHLHIREMHPLAV
jgi:hypothetical protein